MSDVRTRMLRAATALHNACVRAYKEDRCNGCPFSVCYGCILHGHPIEWEDKLKDAKESV